MALVTQFRWHLLSPGDKVLVAVSGGPDSLSLLHLLWAEREARQIGSVEAAHLDHGLRGEESAAEAAWVAGWCAGRGIACHVERVDVAELARQHGKSTQEAARDARYALLSELAGQIGADKIATGHTRDDQTETVLANILRGTGLDGLRGIPERRGLIVRPLLSVSRAEIEAYCAANNLQPRQDGSNLSPDHYTRNRIRLALLPQLRRSYNARVDDALLRLSEIAARDSDYLGTQAAAALAQLTLFSSSARLALDTQQLRALHPALLRYVMRLALAQVRGTAEGAAHSHIERLCRIILSMTESRGGISLHSLFPQPGCQVSIFPTVLRLEPEQTRMSRPLPAPPEQAPLPLAVPGEAVLGKTGWTLTASWSETPGAVRLDADTVDLGSLVVRNRRHGDRIDPLGLGGRHKKVSDIFTDAKVPRSDRDWVPLVADARGLVWIAGHVLSERAKVTEKTAKLLFLSAQEAGVGVKPAGIAGNNRE